MSKISPRLDLKPEIHSYNAGSSTPKRRFYHLFCSPIWRHKEESKQKLDKTENIYLQRKINSYFIHLFLFMNEFFEKKRGEIGRFSKLLSQKKKWSTLNTNYAELTRCTHYYLPVTFQRIVSAFQQCAACSWTFFLRKSR